MHNKVDDEDYDESLGCKLLQSYDDKSPGCKSIDECFAIIVHRQSILFHQQKYVVVTVESAARAHEAGAERS